MVGRFGILITLSLVIVGCGSKDEGSSVDPAPIRNGYIKSTPITDPVPAPPETPSPNTEAVKESDLGVPFYPGAKHEDESLVTDERNHTKNIKVRQFSEDQPDKVIDFYKQKLKVAKGTIQVMRNTNSIELISLGFDGLTANKKERLTVDASRKKGETRTEIDITAETIKSK